MKYAIPIIATSVATVLIYGLAHAFYSVMQTIAATLGGAA
jgi:hypothetical protein